MRIISQDKTRDLPYESCILEADSSSVSAIVGLSRFIIGKYNSLKDSKAVLWAILANYLAGEKRYEMPQRKDDLTYAYRDE